MSGAPVVHILTSDAEMLADIPEGTGESVIASAGPMHNMHGSVATTEYLRNDMLMEGMNDLTPEAMLKVALMQALMAMSEIQGRGDLGMLRMEAEKVVASLRDA